MSLRLPQHRSKYHLLKWKTDVYNIEWLLGLCAPFLSAYISFLRHLPANPQYNQGFSYIMNLSDHFNIKNYWRTDLSSHMSQDKLMDFSAVCNRLDIEVAILLSDFFFQDMQFDKAVVLVLALVFMNTHFVITNLGRASVRKVS